MPDYEVVPEEEAGQISRRRRAKPRMPTFTIERYGGRLIYFWFGMRFGALMKLFKRGNYAFTLNCHPRHAAAVPLGAVELGALLALRGEIQEGRRGARRSSPPPIFVIGHWRTGTTLLHDLFSVDPNLAYPTTFECFFPHHFLLTEEVLSKVMRGLLPKKRPQDDVPVGFDRPQEEEFGMMMLGEGTPYLTHAWPRFGPADTEYLDFKGVPEAEQKKWADAYMWFYRRLAAEAWRQAAGDEDARQCRAAQAADQAVSRRPLCLSRAEPAQRVPLDGEALARALFGARPAQSAQSRSLARRLRARHVRAADRGL